MNKVECYLTIQNLATESQKRLGRHSPSVRRVTQNPPKLEAGEFAVKVLLDIPAAVMETPMPSVKIDIAPDTFPVLDDVTATPVALDLTKEKSA